MLCFTVGTYEENVVVLFNPIFRLLATFTTRKDLQSILVVLLNSRSDDAGSFYLLRSWLGLVAIDPGSFEPIDQPNAPLAMRAGVILRLNLLSENSPSSQPTGYPFRVCLAGDPAVMDPLVVVSSYVAATIRLLIILSPPDQSSGNENADESVSEQLFSDWSENENCGCGVVSLISHILLSLISVRGLCYIWFNYFHPFEFKIPASVLVFFSLFRT